MHKHCISRIQLALTN